LKLISSFTNTSINILNQAKNLTNMMSEFKDILYKKNDDETWTDWNNRLPTDDDKRDYIGETIYAKIYANDKEKAGKITGMLLEMDVEDLIVLLESDELLDTQIEEAYQILREDEEIKMSDEEVLSAEEACRVANEACRVLKEEEKSRAEKEEEIELVKYTALEPDKQDAEEVSWPGSDDYDDECGYYNGGDYKRPVVTITVAEMIEALSKLPPDAKLVMTESGFYSRREFARIMLPEPYIVGTNKMNETDLSKGTQVYRIGHSHQMY
jgi:hypothetical protein